MYQTSKALTLPISEYLIEMRFNFNWERCCALSSTISYLAIPIIRNLHPIVDKTLNAALRDIFLRSCEGLKANSTLRYIPMLRGLYAGSAYPLQTLILNSQGVPKFTLAILTKDQFWKEHWTNPSLASLLNNGTPCLQNLRKLGTLLSLNLNSHRSLNLRDVSSTILVASMPTPFTLS